MLENNIYNIDRNFDYATVIDIVTKSLEKIEGRSSIREYIKCLA